MVIAPPPPPFDPTSLYVGVAVGAVAGRLGPIFDEIEAMMLAAFFVDAFYVVLS